MKRTLPYMAFALTLLTHTVLAAEFDGNCTTSLSEKRMYKTDCSIKTEYQGKEDWFGSDSAKTEFRANPAASIMKAQAFYGKKEAAQQDQDGRTKMTQEQAAAEIARDNCDLSNKDLGYLELDKADLRHCRMVNTSFFGAYLRGANLSGADLRKAYLNLARLEDANFSGANLADAIIFQAIFSKTNFSGANLTNARMIGTLGNVDMHDATIVNGRFGLDVGNQPMGQMKFDSVGGNFANANFEGADLNIANFSFANLTKANLRNTNLYRADLSQADLSGADLTGANLTDAVVDGAIFKDAKGLETVKGWETVKGKCRDCGKPVGN